MKSAPLRFLLPCALLFSLSALAGVRKEVAGRYAAQYENQALILKQPVRGAEQSIFVGPSGGRLDPSTLGSRLQFKVGDQVRITKVEFKDDLVRFALESPGRARAGLLVFRFPTPMTHSFPQQSQFDSALEATFTEGLSYREVEVAKTDYIRAEFGEMVRRFIGTTSTSNEFVMQAVAALNPEYRKAVDAADEQRRRAEGLAQQIDQLRQAERAARRELDSVRTGQAELGNEVAALEDANRQLESRSSRLSAEVDELKGSNRRYRQQITQLERQINAVADKLDVELTNRDQLGDQVDNLNQSLDTLRQERGTLSDRLNRVNVQLGELQKGKEALTASLAESESQRARLEQRYNRLTGDKNSVTSMLAETIDERDQLAAVGELEDLLTLSARRQGADDFEVTEIRLGQHRVGRLEILKPTTAGDIARLRVSLDSPETVAFSERERELFESLGEDWQVEALWLVPDELTAELRSGKETQHVARREAAEWDWELVGVLGDPQDVALQVTLIDSNDRRVELGVEQFEVRPAGVSAWLAGSFSISSALVGGTLAALAMAWLSSRRARVSPPRRRSDTAASVQKRL